MAEVWLSASEVLIWYGKVLVRSRAIGYGPCVAVTFQVGIDALPLSALRVCKRHNSGSP